MARRALAAALLLAAACTHTARTKATPPNRAGAVQTDASVYYLEERASGFDAWAVATYTNTTGAPVFFKRCGVGADGPMYELRRTDPVDPGSPPLVGAVWACVGGVPTGTLLPGRSMTARVWLGSLRSPRANPPVRPAQRVGTFRILFDLCAKPERDSDGCVLIPDEQRQSEPFELRFRARR